MKQIKCPRCGMVSHNQTDVKFGYCGACHDWTDGEVSETDDGYEEDENDDDGQGDY